MSNIYEPEFVKNLFNKMSGSYERMNYVTSFGFSIRWRKQFLKKLGKSDEKKEIIDLLSGLGENWKHLKTNFPNSNFYALDFSDEMVKHSLQKGKKIFNNSLQIFCEDILKSSLPENYFDIVTCAYGLKTFNDEQLDQLAKQVYRILKFDGKFTFVEVSKPKNKILLELYGFYLGRVIPILGKLFLGNPEDYKMLWIYTNNFGNSEKVLKIFGENNLSVKFEKYFYGCASGITGTKIVPANMINR